ncbi:MAG: diacylglycerol kinase family protein [Tenuifilaceae bacterium]
MSHKKQERILFIVNPISGSGKRADISKTINNNLDKSKYAPEIVTTKCQHDAVEITKEYLSKGFKKIVAVGGDGTVNEVARGMINTDAVMGIIPKGSGNGLSRHLHIPMNVNKAIELINAGKVASIDYGLINGTPFFCTAGIGFDAHIGHHFANLSGRGFQNYVKTILKEFFSYKPQPYLLRNDEIYVEKDAFLITAANASQWGNNAYIAPGASVQDGLLDITVVSPFPKFLSPAYGILLFSRMIDKSHFVESFRVSELMVERQSNGYVHYDGEPTSMGKEISLKIKPSGLNIFIP